MYLQRLKNAVFENETNKLRDINEILPKIPNMKWGALTNMYPTNHKVKELNRLLPHDKRWHTVFEDKKEVYVDNIKVRKENKSKWT